MYMSGIVTMYQLESWTVNWKILGLNNSLSITTFNLCSLNINFKNEFIYENDNSLNNTYNNNSKIIIIQYESSTRTAVAHAARTMRLKISRGSYIWRGPKKQRQSAEFAIGLAKFVLVSSCMSCVFVSQSAQILPMKDYNTCLHAVFLRPMSKCKKKKLKEKKNNTPLFVRSLNQRF